ncbi:MAG: DUF5684 domain-containing protein [Verrucomicrobia bacterium]|nr:DUF5684 domain-containing protein [Verrucomicrobiota bacterium]
MNPDNVEQINQTSGAVGIIGGILWLAIVILVIAGVWKTFTKAGQPGWACLVPFYNIIVLLQIVGKPLWWIILMLIPFVNFIIAIIVMVELAKKFGKGVGFALGLVFLGFIFFPILGFGDARYQGSAAA